MSKRLIVTPRGIYSKCFRCGMVEWEWAPGDSFRYIEYLARKYQIEVEDLLEAIDSECSGYYV